MLLAINIGNQKITFAVFAEKEPAPLCTFAISSDIQKTVDEYIILLNAMLFHKGIAPGDIHDTIIASVVPGLTETVKKTALILTGKAPLTVGPGVKTGFAIRIDDPAELGADLVANAAAAVALLKAEGTAAPALILDMGAVTSLFAVNKGREVVGGVILPGVGISLDALHRETALLPNVALTEPSRAIGKNTKESLCAGVLLGQAAMIDGLCDRFEKELKLKGGEARLFATGDFCAGVLANCRHDFRFDPDLTVKGLACIYANTVNA